MDWGFVLLLVLGSAAGIFGEWVHQKNCPICSKKPLEKKDDKKL